MLPSPRSPSHAIHPPTHPSHHTQQQQQQQQQQQHQAKEQRVAALREKQAGSSLGPPPSLPHPLPMFFRKPAAAAAAAQQQEGGGGGGGGGGGEGGGQHTVYSQEKRYCLRRLEDIGKPVDVVRMPWEKNPAVRMVLGRASNQDRVQTDPLLHKLLLNIRPSKESSKDRKAKITCISRGQATLRVHPPTNHFILRCADTTQTPVLLRRRPQGKSHPPTHPPTQTPVLLRRRPQGT